ncbi:MAG: hypothetical protein ABEJ65_04930, partial [bacterium]
RRQARHLNAVEDEQMEEELIEKLVALDILDEGAELNDVLDIDEESIQSSPEMINEFGGQFVKGVIEIDRAEESAGDVSQGHPGLRSASSSPSGETTEHEDNKQESILLLDLDELFTGEEIEKIRETREEHRGEDT